MTATNFDNCVDIRDKRKLSGPIIDQFDGKDIKIGDKVAKKLKCLGGGDHGVTFIGTMNDQNVIVKLTHDRDEIDDHARQRVMRKELWQQAALNQEATGSGSFVKTMSEGFTQEMPQVYGEVWSMAPGRNMREIERSTGFHDSQEFLDFAQRACEAVIFMWGVGMHHGDIQRGNLVWDSSKQLLTLVDYENFGHEHRTHHTDHNEDVEKMDAMFRKYRNHHPSYDDSSTGRAAQDMVMDLRHNTKHYAKSLDNFLQFYKRHFGDNIVLSSKKDLVSKK
jgi:thiamine kinase-like enzyme